MNLTSEDYLADKLADRLCLIPTYEDGSRLPVIDKDEITLDYMSRPYQDYLRRIKNYNSPRVLFEVNVREETFDEWKTRKENDVSK